MDDSEQVEPQPAIWGRARPGVDASREVRPGVPREYPVPADSGAPWDVPPLQPGAELLGRRGQDRARVRVFGTAQPARGLSGMLRKLAYRVPEHRPSRWSLLLAADRIEALGHRARGSAWLVLAMGAIWMGFRLAGPSRARR